MPGALPNIVTGIRTGMGFAWRGLIAAEMIATNVGLGYMLFLARDFYRTEVIVFGMIVIGLLWLLLDRLIAAVPPHAAPRLAEGLMMLLALTMVLYLVAPSAQQLIETLGSLPGKRP